MRSWLHVYPAFLRTALLSSIQYRASGAIWMIGSVLEPLVFLTVWSTVADSQGGTVAGYTAKEFAAYYAILLIVNHLTFTWIMHEFQYRIQYGSFSFALLRPVHPIHADIAENLAFKAVQLAVILPAFLVLCLVFRPQFDPVGWSLALFFPVLLVSLLLRFLVEWTLALAAFWTTRVTAMNQIYFSLQIFLSGRMAPIALLPLWIADVAQHLPFYYAVGFPVDLALGRLSPEAAIRGVVVQLIWLALSSSMIVLIWRRAARRFTAVGS